MSRSDLAPAASLFRIDTARLKREWLGNARRDLLAAATVALALIPESIAFSLVAGVAPKVGLYASFTMSVMVAIFGGRPGMISAATGAMALLMVPLVAKHGLEYLFAATVLTGVIQLAFRLLRLSRYVKFVPRSVMTGFVNALAISVLLAQLPQLAGGGITAYAIVAAGLAIIYLLPRATTALPSPLVAVVVLTVVAVVVKLPVHTVGDAGELPNALPQFHLPRVPFTVETLQIIAPFSLGMAMVGLIESLLTASVLDEMTDTRSDKHSEAHGQGLANIATGFFGGMAGCAMIGQSVINARSGGRGRLSTLCAGGFMLFFVLVLGGWVARIPSAALVAVMVTVCIDTFDWKSLGRLRVMPITETLVMVGTVVTVLMTHNLAIGVLVGVLLSAIFFARSAGKLISIERTVSLDGRRVYVVRGELFFVSVEQFVDAFDFHEKVTEVEIDLTHAHVWDASAVAAIDRVVLKLRSAGAQVHLSGMNQASVALVERLALHEHSGGAGGAGSPGH